MKLTPISFDKVLLYLTSIAAAVLLTLTIRKELTGPEIAFVDIGKLTHGYQLKKDLEQASGQNLYRIKYVIDSLEMVKKGTGGSPETEEKIVQAQNAFNEYYTRSSQENTQKIWDRLNPLMEQYGKEKDLELLIGANGAGTVLYGSAARDVTEDLLQYINSKYEKGS